MALGCCGHTGYRKRPVEINLTDDPLPSDWRIF